jgi:hypothetical protein
MENKNKHLLELSTHEKESNWDEKIESLYLHQFKNWSMVNNHYQHFESIEKRSIFFDGFRIDLQHNPARARSTCADLSQKKITSRPCFLCNNNLPEEQKGYSLLDKYLLLVNPFPIFKRHLTISDFEHTPQQIENRIIDLLSIAKMLSSYTLFYNGPQCGASAPDHFHFQAAQKGIMPIDIEIDQLNTKNKTVLFSSDDIQITQINNYLRTAIVFESSYMEPIDYFFTKTVSQLPFDKTSNEPMLNLLANYQNGKYRLVLFPRKQQRPSCYFSEEPHRILVSPASVEMGGIIITPRAEDFHRITKKDLETIFSDTSLTTDNRITYSNDI